MGSSESAACRRGSATSVMTTIPSETRGNAELGQVPACRLLPKRAVLVNDRPTPMPGRLVKVSVIRDQAGVPCDHALVRDHNSPHDVVMADHGTADLAEGTVFYSLPACDSKPQPGCTEPPKRVVVVDDRWEVVVKPGQSGRSIKDLFGLTGEVELLRDLESPVDEVVADETVVNLADGEVFRTRKRCDVLTIIVNKKKFTTVDGVKPVMTGREIAALAYENPDDTCVSQVKDGKETEVGLEQSVKIHGCDEFKVIRKNVNAGFQPSRIDRELNQLRANGVKVTLIVDPAPAVIFHDVPTRLGCSPPTSDVLVKVPGGYPATFLDNAFLPDGSSLQGRVPGGVQHTETFGGRVWRQISIHPHSGKAVVWNKDRHGFHTYYDEILSWLDKAQ